MASPRIKKPSNNEEGGVLVIKGARNIPDAAKQNILPLRNRVRADLVKYLTEVILFCKTGKGDRNKLERSGKALLHLVQLKGEPNATRRTPVSGIIAADTNKRSMGSITEQRFPNGRR